MRVAMIGDDSQAVANLVAERIEIGEVSAQILGMPLIPWSAAFQDSILALQATRGPVLGSCGFRFG